MFRSATHGKMIVGMKTKYVIILLASTEKSYFFESQPVKVNLGDLRTSFHEFSLRLKSAIDSFEGDDSEDLETVTNRIYDAEADIRDTGRNANLQEEESLVDASQCSRTRPFSQEVMKSSNKVPEEDDLVSIGGSIRGCEHRKSKKKD
eukprot:Rmarinus@m.842